MPVILTLILLSFPLLMGSCRHNQSYEAPNLRILDSLMNYSDEFSLLQLKKISELKQKRRHAKTPSDKFIYDNLLFDAYYTVDADSALLYADSSLEDARLSGNNNWITKSLINKSNILAAAGLLSNALVVMKEIDPTKLDNDLLVDYYGQMIYLYSHVGNYVGGTDNDYYVTERLYRDSIMQVITPSHPEYLWYKGWNVLSSNQNPDSIIQALKENLSMSNLDERQDAKNAYVLSKLYEKKGDRENYINSMALSAIVDVKIANSEISSLEDLATLVFEEGAGDVDRAYNYIDYSLNKAINYPNRTKALGISRNLERISYAYQERIKQQQHRTTLFLILVCVLAGILFIAIIVIVNRNKKIRRQRLNTDETNDQLHQKVEELSLAEGQLSEMNKLLKGLNDDLKAKNTELYEANFVKEEYIGYVFSLCSRYIAKIAELRRNIYLKVVKKQYREIEAETSDLDMKDEVRDFYNSFDTIFLNLYPTFVNDFNELLLPGKQIVLKDGELLNMELRIYALVRLGINDSVKISDFLHCAPQTVYNYRLRARSRSPYSKNEFLEKIQSIGHFQGKES